MRHRKSGRTLGRKSSHRRAMFRNMVTSLIEHERIKTTEPKAKELRRFADKTISISLRLGELLDKPREERTPEEQARYVHALRMASRMVRVYSAASAVGAGATTSFETSSTRHIGAASPTRWPILISRV